MGFQEVSSLDADVTIALGKTNKETGKPYPKQAEGYYLGSRKVENKRGESKLHFLQTSAGNLGIWGTTDLDRKLGQVNVGTMVRITSTGTKPTPNGDMYTYKVESDKTNTIEVSAQEDTSANQSDFSDLDEDGNETEELSSTAFQQDANLAAAKRKADVENMLKARGVKKN